MTLEMGKPPAEAHGEVAFGAEFLGWVSQEPVRDYGRYLTTLDGRKQDPRPAQTCRPLPAHHAVELPAGHGSFTGTADTPPAMDVGCLADMLFLFVVGRARNLGSRFEGFVEVATFHVEVRQDTLEPSG